MTSVLTYRTQSVDDLRNQLAEEIGMLTPRLAERPQDAGWRINSIERLRGQIDTLDTIEREFTDIEKWAVEQRWTLTQMILVQYDTLLSVAQSNPNDTSSGRHGDAQRCYNDGRREVIGDAQMKLRSNPHFPGNTKS